MLDFNHDHLAQPSRRSDVALPPLSISRGKSDLEIIREHEDWLCQAPRTSLEIASDLLIQGRCSVKHMDIAMHEMVPVLNEAGYQAMDEIEADLWQCAWVKV